MSTPVEALRASIAAAQAIREAAAQVGKEVADRRRQEAEKTAAEAALNPPRPATQ